MSTLEKVLTFTLAALLLPPIQASPLINEIVTNGSTHRDSNGNSHDWIELHNPDDSQINLKDHYLSDDPLNRAKWRFPEDLFIPANGYLVIFSSDLDGMIAGQAHTNFKLSSNGESLFLVSPDGQSILDSLADRFPALQNNQSFGRTESTEPITLDFLEEATPGATNSIPKQIALIHSFESNRVIIDLGDSINLSWNFDAASMTLRSTPASQQAENPFKIITTSTEPSGQIQITPNETATYTLTAKKPWSTASKSVVVEVRPTLSVIKFHPPQIVQGGKTAIWLTDLEPSTDSGLSLDFGDGFGLHRKFPMTYTPFNETLISAKTTWKTSSPLNNLAWIDPDFDDSSWPEIELPTSEFWPQPLRKSFQISSASELLSCTIRTRTFFDNIFINGQEILAGSQGFGYGGYLREIHIPLSLLKTGTNVLAATGQAQPWLAITAWRNQPEEATTPLDLTLNTPDGPISGSISLTLLAPDSLPPAAPLILNEAVFTVAGEILTPRYQYVEILNNGNEALDLEGFQVTGRAIADLGRANSTSLPPGALGLIHFYHSYPDSWNGNVPVIANFAGPYLPYDLAEDYTLEILDPFGRTIDRFLPPNSDSGFDSSYQRIDPSSPFEGLNAINLDDSGIFSTIGEQNFVINEATLSPAYALPGEPVTLRWNFSRDISFELQSEFQGSAIALQGKAGEAILRMPNGLQYGVNWTLRLQGEHSTFLSTVDGARSAPRILSFETSKRVYQPGETLTLNWNKRAFYLHNTQLLAGDSPVSFPSTQRAASHLPEQVTSGDRLLYRLFLNEYFDRSINFTTVPMTILFENGDFSFQNWRNEHGLPPAPYADTDQDSLSNLLEYAIGSDPRRQTRHPIKLQPSSHDGLEITYPNNLLAPDITLSLEFSDDQISWKPLDQNFSFLGSVAPDESPIAQDRYLLHPHSGQPSAYFRLRAILDPVAEGD